MNRLWQYKKTIAAALLLVAGGAALALWYSSNHSEAPYRVVTVARGDIDTTVVATGVLQPSNRLEIKPPIAGRVEKILVHEGEYVRRGTVLAWMSSSERAALIDAARAKGPEELKRWEELYRPTPIIAPIDGTIILRNAEPGQTFQVQDAMLVMSDRLIVRAQVDETDIAQIKLRQPARITSDAYPDQSIDGTVVEIAFEAKTVNNVTTYEVDVLPVTVPPFLRSGMTTNVSFITASRRDVVVVPTEIVRRRQGRAYVLVAGEGDKPTEREIKLGLNNGRRAEVLEGLSAGDTVLAPPAMKLGGGGATGSNPLSPFGRGRRR